MLFSEGREGGLCAEDPHLLNSLDNTAHRLVNCTVSLVSAGCGVPRGVQGGIPTRVYREGIYSPGGYYSYEPREASMGRVLSSSGFLKTVKTVKEASLGFLKTVKEASWALKTVKEASWALRREG